MIKKIVSLVFILTLYWVPIVYAAPPTLSQYQPDNIMVPFTPGFNAKDLRAIANVAASQTDSVIVAAVAGKKIRVTGVYALCGATATNLTFNSKGSGAGTAISPVIQNGVYGGEVLGFNPMGWFETASGEGLTVTTGAGSTTGIGIIYTTY